VLQHFLSKSPWDEGAVMDRVAWEVDQLFGEDPNTCLIADESSFSKKGDKSAGVNRQWCGEKGQQFSALKNSFRYQIVSR
jgi:SRSO17 transposase